MNDLRNLISDRICITTFIVGNQYITVYHLNTSFEEILSAIADHHPSGELVKPFCIVSSTIMTYDDAETLKPVCDIILVDGGF